jgi:hypothetical protein
MNPTSSKEVSRSPEEAPRPELGPAHQRDRLLQGVQAARKRLSPAPYRMAKPR